MAVLDTFFLFLKIWRETSHRSVVCRVIAASVPDVRHIHLNTWWLLISQKVEEKLSEYLANSPHCMLEFCRLGHQNRERKGCIKEWQIAVLTYWPSQARCRKQGFSMIGSKMFKLLQASHPCLLRLNQGWYHCPVWTCLRGWNPYCDRQSKSSFWSLQMDDVKFGGMISEIHFSTYYTSK